MRFNVGDTLLYIDDGNYPSLHNKTCTVLGYVNLLGKKLVEVQFDVTSGEPFTNYIESKNFKLVRRYNYSKGTPMKSKYRCRKLLDD